MNQGYSIVIPAYNEEGAIGAVLKSLTASGAPRTFEVIVVNDCSTDKTAEVVRGFASVRLIENIQNFGYGYSLKRGIAAAAHPHIIIMDADGSYPTAALPGLIEEYERGFDMVVGARQGLHYRGSAVKSLARFFFRVLSEFTTGRRIPDINSGCRVFAKHAAMRFFPTTSSGFSFTTTITLAYMLNHLSVEYVPIEYHKRAGHSKVRYLRDTLRSTQIIVEAIIYYNPLKIFLLCAIGIFLAGIVSFLIAIFSIGAALLFFLTVALSIAMLALGFIAVLLQFMHTDANAKS